MRSEDAAMGKASAGVVCTAAECIPCCLIGSFANWWYTFSDNEMTVLKCMTQLHSGKGWNLSGPRLLFIKERWKGAKWRRVRRSAAVLRGKTLNLVSCDAPLPSSPSNFFSDSLPWVNLRKAFKGSEFVLSIVLFQPGNVSQLQFHLKRSIDWLVLQQSGPQKQQQPTTHYNLPASTFLLWRLQQVKVCLLGQDFQSSGWKIREQTSKNEASHDLKSVSQLTKQKTAVVCSLSQGLE